MAQTKLWRRDCGSSADDNGIAVALDNRGNVFITGYAEGNLNHQAYHRCQMSPVGGIPADLFVIKYDALGKELWTRLWGTYRHEAGVSLAADVAGNVLVMGSVDGANREKERKYEICLLRYSGAGKLDWSRIIGTKGCTYAGGMARDDAGNLYLAGSTNGEQDNPMDMNTYDMYICKCDSTGTELWSRRLGSSVRDWGTAVATDHTQCVYVTGYTTGVFDSQSFAGGYDVFLVKYDGSGTRLWTRSYGSAGRDDGSALAVDAANNIYIAGSTTGDLDDQKNSGEYDLFLMKLDGSGNKIWTRLWGTKGNDGGTGVAVDQFGNAYVVGRCNAPFEGANNPQSHDLCLLKYSAQGELLWVCYGRTGNGAGSGIALDQECNAYCVGNTSNYYGSGDILLMKIAPYAPSFDCDKASTIQEKLICGSARLSSLDTAISNLYRKCLTASPNSAKVKKGQLHWLQSDRNHRSTAASLEECLISRLNALQAIQAAGR